ncbi:endothelin-converting enzyme homolog isoform X2 [Asterias rubens]|uniref:endothelin-converting enzyme homolog isoform X2 n=1 Tax=Asterias rubens TaxID=7604 RepID=UPI0014556615|nr:endothelin-converting enzyme homolog isoform X2 [Asterias rubens]
MVRKLSAGPVVHWQNLSRQRSDRCMGVLTLSCLLLLVLVVATVGYVCNRERPHTTTCLEPRCIESTANILRVMDLDADPCQDFYQYACGKFKDVTEIPEGRSKWGSFSKVGLRNKHLMRKLLERDGFEYKGVHSEAFEKAKKYFQTCMNETLTEESGAAPLLRVVESFGGWSMLSNETLAGQWNETTWNLTTRLIQLHKMRMFSLFNNDIGPDDRDSTANIMKFYQSGLGLSLPEIYNGNSTVQKYLDGYIELGATAVTLLRSHDYPGVMEHAHVKEEARRRMQEILEFETKLSKLFVPKSKLQDPEQIYNKLPLQELIEMIPEINLPAYMTETYGEEISSSLEVIVYTPSYFPKLNQLIKETPPQLVADYTMWYMIRPYLGYLSRPYQDAIMVFSKVVSGVGTKLPLWQLCMSRVDSAFGFVTGALYVEEEDSEKTKKKALEMIEDIRFAFLENLPLVEWMDDETRERAEDKVRAIKNKIGFPDWILDPKKLDEYHDGLSISTENSLDSIVNIVRFFRQKGLKDFGTPVDKTRWSMAPAEVNAYYSASLNQMVFPSGILQPPFFDNNVPMSMNYGAIGMIMGHELTHGFDNTGRKFDKLGNLRDWWENQSAVAYEARADCMVNQYSQYQFGEKNLDGHFTLGENIADNGGVKIAYMAYKRWRKDNPHDLQLQLNLTLSQEFFLGMAQVWCSYETPQYSDLMILTDPHAIDQFRIRGALSNLPEFSTAFNCPSGSPMNPEHKCQVW